MALVKSIALNDSPYGVAAPSAYARISAAEFNARNQMVLTVDTWASEAAYRSARFAPLRTRKFVIPRFDQDAPGNIKTNLYGWLKTQPEFSGAQDA